MASADSFFERAIASAREAGDARGEQAYAVLEHTMRRASDASARRARGEGIVEVPFFLFGRLVGDPRGPAIRGHRDVNAAARGPTAELSKICH